MTTINAELYDVLIAVGAPEDKAKDAARTVPDPANLATKDDIAQLEIRITRQFNTLMRFMLGLAAAAVAATVGILRFLG